MILQFQISDYLWSRSEEIEPRSSNTNTIKKRNCERRWPGLSLKSPGIRPKGLPGKNHPNPLPKIGSRPSKDENVSPLASPSFGSPVAVFKQSPASTPVTPSFQTSPRESDSSLREVDPIKMPVILPHVPVTSSFSSFPAGKPPPLPPKPRNTLPLPPRDTSPPPPIPPRRVSALPSTSSLSHSHSHRSPLESRPPLMDPVFPQQSLPPTILPRHRNVNGCSLDPPISPALTGRWTETSACVVTGSGLSTSPLSRPPTSLPHSASWLPTNSQPLNGLGPLSAGPEIGSHFTFGAHVAHVSSSQTATVSPQLPPRPSRTTSTPR